MFNKSTNYIYTQYFAVEVKNSFYTLSLSSIIIIKLQHIQHVKLVKKSYKLKVSRSQAVENTIQVLKK